MLDLSANGGNAWIRPAAFTRLAAIARLRRDLRNVVAFSRRALEEHKDGSVGHFLPDLISNLALLLEQDNCLIESARWLALLEWTEAPKPQGISVATSEEMERVKAVVGSVLTLGEVSEMTINMARTDIKATCLTLIDELSRNRNDNKEGSSRAV